MTREEHTAIEELSGLLREHVATCRACNARVMAHEETLYTGRQGQPGLVSQMQTIREWRERAKFVEQSLVGGILRKAGELVLTAIVLGAVLLAHSHFGNRSEKTTTDTITHDVRGK